MHIETKMPLKMGKKKRMINGVALQGGIWFSNIVTAQLCTRSPTKLSQKLHKKEGDDGILLEMVAEAISLKTAQIK